MALLERGKKAVMTKATEGFQSAVSLFSTHMECAHPVYTLDLCLPVILYFSTNVHKGRQQGAFWEVVRKLQNLGSS